LKVRITFFNEVGDGGYSADPTLSQIEQHDQDQIRVLDEVLQPRDREAIKIVVDLMNLFSSLVLNDRVDRT
jgi:hypothetical protein